MSSSPAEPMRPSDCDEVAARLDTAAGDLVTHWPDLAPLGWTDDQRDEVVAALRGVARRAEARAEQLRREAA